MNPVDQAGIAQALWKIGDLPRLVQRTARSLGASAEKAASLPPVDPSEHDIERWVSNVSADMELDVISVQLPLREIGTLLEQHPFVVLPVHSADSTSLRGGFVVTGLDKGKVTLLAPNANRLTSSLEEVLSVANPTWHAGVGEEARSEFELIQLAFPNAAIGGKKSILQNKEESVWLFRLKLNTGWAPLLRTYGVAKGAAITLMAEVGTLIVTLLTWALIAKLAISGAINIVDGWFWLLVLAVLGGALLSTISFIILQSLSLKVTTLFQRLMLQGIFVMPDSRLRTEGTGQSLTRVMEANELASAVMMLGSSFFRALVSCVGVIVMIAVSAWPFQFLVVFALTCVLLGILGARAWATSRDRVEGRMQETHRLFDFMAGFRTLRAQGMPWTTDDEDRGLSRYLSQVDSQNSVATLLVALPAYLWLFAAIFVTALSVREEASLVDLILGGGIAIAGYRAFGALVYAYVSGVPLVASGHRVAEMIEAARAPSPRKAILPENTREDRPVPLISLRNVVFSYPTQKKPIFRDVNLDIYPGDRILLRGQSGGGKSTLVSLLAGLREPTGGLMMVQGFDVKSVGTDTLRRVTALAPQFHENAIIPHTLIFNLCLGRRWPPQQEDRDLAEQICEELGLGDLIEFMPEGLDQRVGDSGWSLSHGEQCRIFLARTLMQERPIVVLDESFSALDPESLRTCIRCATRRANALIVIEHFS